MPARQFHASRAGWRLQRWGGPHACELKYGITAPGFLRRYRTPYSSPSLPMANPTARGWALLSPKGSSRTTVANSSWIPERRPGLRSRSQFLSPFRRESLHRPHESVLEIRHFPGLNIENWGTQLSAWGNSAFAIVRIQAAITHIPTAR